MRSQARRYGHMLWCVHMRAPQLTRCPTEDATSVLVAMVTALHVAGGSYAKGDERESLSRSTLSELFAREAPAGTDREEVMEGREDEMMALESIYATDADAATSGFQRISELECVLRFTVTWPARMGGVDGDTPPPPLSTLRVLHLRRSWYPVAQSPIVLFGNMGLPPHVCVAISMELAAFLRDMEGAPCLYDAVTWCQESAGDVAKPLCPAIARPARPGKAASKAPTPVGTPAANAWLR